MTKRALTFLAPMQTVNESNGSAMGKAQWDKIRRRKEAHRVIDLVTGPLTRPRGFPMVVELIRLSCRTLDDDGLRSAGKGLRDALAKWLGVDDGDVSKIRFMYRQWPCKQLQFGTWVRIHENSRLIEQVKPYEGVVEEIKEAMDSAFENDCDWAHGAPMKAPKKRGKRVAA